MADDDYQYDLAAQEDEPAALKKDDSEPRPSDSNYTRLAPCPVTLGLFGQNYLSWKSLMPIFLQQTVDVWEVVKGDLVEPIPTEPATELNDDQKKVKVRYDRANRKARLQLFSSINDKLIVQMFYGQTQDVRAADIWSQIASKFGVRAALRQGSAIAKLMQFKFNKSKTADQNLDRFRDLQAELTDSGIEIDQKVQVEQLLNALPHSWEPLRMAFSARPEGDRDVSSLMEIIKNEAIRQRPSKELDQATAMLSQMRVGRRFAPKRRFQNRSHRRNAPSHHSQGSSSSGYGQQNRSRHQSNRPNRRQVKCYNCGATGHFKSQCTRPRRDQGYQGGSGQHRSHARASTAVALLAHVKYDTSETDEFLVDSGASHHCSSSRKWFTSFDQQTDMRAVTLASNQKLRVTASGTAELTVGESKQRIALELKNVLLVPSVRKNLLSVSQLTDDDFEVTFKRNHLIISRNDMRIRVPKIEGLYRLRMDSEIGLLQDQASDQESVDQDADSDLDDMNHDIPSESQVMSAIGSEKTMSAQTQSLRSLHEKFAHVNRQYVIKYLNQQGIKYIDDLDQCDACLKGKLTRITYRSRPDQAKAQKPGIITADLCSPNVESIEKANHFLLFTDEATSYRKVEFLQKKSDTYRYVASYVKWFRNVVGENIQRLHSDNGTEFRNQKVKKILERIGAEQTFAPPGQPRLTGKAERGNRTLVNLARSVLIGAGLENKKFLWDQAILFCVQVLNQVLINEKTLQSPFEMIYKRKPFTSRMYAFGTPCYVHNKNPNGKLDDRGIAGIFVGYLDYDLGFRVYIPEKRIIMRSKDVTFAKIASTKRQGSGRTKASGKTSASENTAEAAHIAKEANHDTEVTGSRINSPKPAAPMYESASSDYESDEEGFVRINPKANKKRTERLQIVADLNHLSGISEKERAAADTVQPKSQTPMTYQEAMASPDRVQWTMAVEEELQAMADMKVWTPATLPPGRKAIGSKWVFKYKANPDGSGRYKARVVAKGYSQKKEIDFFADKIYSPVSRAEGIRTILSLAAQEKLFLNQFDVRAAFLQAELEEDLYLEVPEGVRGVQANKVLKLLRSIYGLKQSSRNFFDKLTKILLSRGLQQSKTDSCIFFKNGENRMLLCIWVDDAILATKTERQAEEFITSLRKEFEITTSGLRYFLGLQIERGSDFSVHIHQKKFVDELVQRFGMSDSKGAVTPCDNSIYSIETNGPCSNTEYRSLIGALLYLACGTRVDISFVTSYLSRYMDKSTPQHFQAGLRVLRYLKTTSDLGITYRSDDTQGTLYFSDSDFAGSIEDRKSTSGCLILRQGGPIIWSSTKQANISLSSMESEFVASTECIKSALWLRNLLGELGIPEKPIIQIDSMSAIQLLKNARHYRRAKHMELRFHYIRQLYSNQEIGIEHVGSANQRADYLTKPCVKSVFLNQRELSGLERWRQ